MPFLSSLRRAPALLLFGLLLGGCFSSRPCPSDRELDTTAAGQLDYVFEDGVAASADLEAPSAGMGVGVSSGLLTMLWNSPAPSGGGEGSNFQLAIELPEADGSFDLSDVTAHVCACESGFVSSASADAQCMLNWKTPLGPAECRALAGQLTIVHSVAGNCEATRGGCLRTNVIEVVLSEDTKKGLLGSVSFVESSAKSSGSCVSSPILGGLH